MASALPEALAERGHEVVVLSPLYGCVERERHGIEPTGLTLPAGRLWEAPRRGRLRFAFLEAAPFDRAGIYGEGGDYPDNAARFAFFCRSLLPASRALGFSPDVLHLNDWQTSPATLFAEGTPSLLTIHNLGYQGLFPLDEAALLFSGETPEAWIHHGQLAFLKGGISTADLVTTVSPTYAREIRATELGFGLGEVLRGRGERLLGILNGIDIRAWDPAADGHLPANYSRSDRGGKRRCKGALQEELGLPVDERPLLVGMVTRIAGQKGFDLLLPALEELLRRDLQLAILGEGDPVIEAALRAFGDRHPEKLALRFAFDEALARRIYAGCDAFLMPSAYEPCGLSQLYALRYGTLPIVRATGGLRDTVRDGETGFSFEEYRPEAMLEAIGRAIEAFGERGAWEGMVERGMEEDFSWDASARDYEAAYRAILPAHAVAPAPSSW